MMCHPAALPVIRSLALLGVLLFSGCESQGPCLQAVVPGVVVTVVDRISSENLAETASVTVRRPKESEVLERDGEVFYGAWNWAGTLQVDASAPGHVPRSLIVTVQPYSCFVLTEHLTVALDRDPEA